MRKIVLDWLRKPGLRTRLVLGFSLTIAFILIAIAIAIQGCQRSLAAFDTYIDRDDRASHLSVASRAGMEKARRYEKEFLIKVKVFSFEEASLRYATLVRSELAGVRANLAILRSVRPDPVVDAGVQAIDHATLLYETGFLRVVALYERLGKVGDGLEGALRGHSDAIEDLLGQSGNELPRIALLSMRRHEKDFIQRGQLRYSGLFDDAAFQLRKEAMHAALAPAAREKLLLSLQNYQAAFQEYVAVTRQINAATVEYLTAVHYVEAQLQQLRDLAERNKAATRSAALALNQDIRLMAMAAGTVTIVLSCLVALHLIRYASTAIGACVRFAHQLAHGDWCVRLPASSGHGEFAVLSNALNSMANAMANAHARDQQRTAELLRLNRKLQMLSFCNNATMRATSEAELMHTVCQHLTGPGGYLQAWIALAHQDEACGAAPTVAAAATLAEDGMVTLGGNAGPDSASGRAIRDNQPIVVHDPAAQLDICGQAASLSGMKACLAVPMRFQGLVLGSLTVYADLDLVSDQAETQLLQELADDLSFGVGSLREADRRVAAEQALAYQVNHDTVTGLANRNLFSDRLRQACLHAARVDRQVAVMVVSLERLQTVEKALGHAAGKVLLQQVAAMLSAHLSQEDSLARLAGEEFAVAIGDITTVDDVVATTRTLLQALQQPEAADSTSTCPLACIGISLFPKDDTETDGLLRCAQAAVSSARVLGGGRFRFFAPEMNERSSSLLALEAELRRALAHGELRVYYQPRINLASGELAGAEALVRWQHPQRGLVPPAEFIPAAENTGLIAPLGAWVIEEVCRQQRAWLDGGLAGLPVAVNLAPCQLHDAGLPGFIARTLAAYGLQARQLELEITESALMDNLDQAIAAMHCLKKTGLQLALDDFGTGHSSLSRLRQFPIDHLKIDQSFVRNLITDPGDAAICTAIIDLAHNLHLTVIAEGVETEGQFHYLRQHHCDAMQGYYFSRPVPAPDYARLLAQGQAFGAPVVGASAQRTILLVDDEPNILAALRRLLRRDGYQILCADSAQKGFELLATCAVQVILSDQRMPEMNGIEFLSRVRELYPETIRIMLSGYTDLHSVTESVNRGSIYKFLTKPWSDDTLRNDIREAFLRHESVRRRA